MGPKRTSGITCYEENCMGVSVCIPLGSCSPSYISSFQCPVARSLVKDVARPENMWRSHSEKVSNPCTKAFLETRGCRFRKIFSPCSYTNQISGLV